MGTIWVKEMTGGLDTRRLPETTPGGVLMKAKDGHITRGGEFEKRAAFVPKFALPEGTVGLAHTTTGLVVFGHATAPALPTGVYYARLRHPDGVTALVDVPSYDLFDGKIYSVGVFADGSVHHFYDGVRVDDWYDGRARVSFSVVGGDGSSELSNLTADGVSILTAPVAWVASNSDTAAAIAAEINDLSSDPDYTALAIDNQVIITAASSGEAANGRVLAATVAGGLVLEMPTPAAFAGGGTTGGSVAVATFALSAGGPGGRVANITVGGVPIIGSGVDWSTSGGVTAGLIAAAINAHTSSPDYAASATGATVTITTATRTSAVNGIKPIVSTSGGLSVDTLGFRAAASFSITGNGDGGPLSGGGRAVATILPMVAGVQITAAPVPYRDSLSLTAGDIAAAVNAHTSVPNYTATAAGATITITAADIGAAANGRAFSFTIDNNPSGVTTTLAATANGVFVGGLDQVSSATAFVGGTEDDSFTPGLYVRTVKSKMYSTAASVLHFSGIEAPTEWTTDAVGAGFINMAKQNSGSEQLTALARYQNLLAVFAPEVVQIWFIDPDPNLNTQSQVLVNTGTSFPRSVTQFGDADVFYLDDSGLRSLRARDSSNAAATTDIGVPVDDLLVAKLEGLVASDRANITGLINPVDKRFWLVMKDEVFVFSFYENAKVSAWSTYELASTVGGVKTTFTCDYAIVANRRVYIRGGDTIYVYGGTEAAPEYDETEAEAWLPYLDANRPTAHKDWEGIDVALTGLWEIRAATQPTDLDAAEIVARAYQTTYNMHRVTYNHTSSHLSLRAISKGEGRAVLSALALHFRGGEDET
jgi:hypothetical protein